MENNNVYINEKSFSQYSVNSNKFWLSKLYKKEDNDIENRIYTFDCDSIMNLLYNLNQDYLFLNKYNVKIINYDNKTNKISVSIKIGVDCKIESFIYKEVDVFVQKIIVNMNIDYNSKNKLGGRNCD